MELSEDERNELMKKESSRLLKTGHRVSYSPRKEKALKIYLDGGPTKDSGQDWWPPGARGSVLVLFVFLFLIASSGCCTAQKTGRTTLNPSVTPDGYLNSRQHCEAVALSPSNLSPQTGSENPTVHYSVCTVKFKGMYENYSVQKKRESILYRRVRRWWSL